MNAWMKRSLAMLMCLVMLCTLVPAFAQAEDIEIIPVEEETGEQIALIDEPAAEPAAVSNGDGTTTYRALLIGQKYSGDEALFGDKDVALMKTLLKGVNGGQGGSFSVSSIIDASWDEFYSGIDDAFAGADSDDVSLFYYSGHGVVTGDTSSMAGALVTYEYDGSNYGFDTLDMETLAGWLGNIPGKVVVLLDSCGSGSAIYQNGVSYRSGVEEFNEAAVRAFSAQDEAVANVGEFRTSKFYVLTAASYDSTSLATTTGSLYTLGLKEGAEGAMPADTDGDDKASVHELYTYIENYVAGEQATQEYPAYSSYAVFSKLEKPVITTQPKTTTICAGTDVSFKVVASGATSYQWYYRTSSSGSWAKSTVSTATKATLKYTNVSLGHNGYQYRCKVSNASGYVYTNTVTLKVQEAPVITTQPKNTTINAGDDVSFTVKASGALSYQWYYRESSSDSWKKSTVSTATTPTLKYSNLGVTKNGRQYRCLVANDKAYVYTNTVTLTVLGKPAITTQPKSVTASVDTTAKFTVKATGAETYQWYYRTSSSGSWAKTSLTGNKTATLSVKATAARTGYQYRCKVSNDYGYVYSSAATLTVQSVAPIITSQPKDTTINAGEDVSFTVKATNALSYQWYYRESSSDSWKKSTVSTATTPTLKYSNLGVTKNGRQYRCLVANDKAYVYTNIVTLTVIGGAKPTITTQPTSVATTVNATAKFTVKATGATEYQWYYRTSSTGSWAKSTLTGATTATLSVTATTARNGYQYRCKVSNAGGYVYSNTATLTVQAASTTTYRALLIGQTYVDCIYPENVPPLNCDKDVRRLESTFSTVQGAKGGSIQVTSIIDASYSGIQNAIQNTFAGADSDDVSIFYYSGHGVADSTDQDAGAIITLESDGTYRKMYLSTLASLLKDVPGKVVVMMDSCGSGAAIYENGKLVSNAADTDAFNAAVVNAFAEADEVLVDNTGEFRESKFYVLTGSAHLELSWESSNTGGWFTYYFATGIGSGKPADGNGNGTITLSELYDYIYPNVYGIVHYDDNGNRVYQNVQVYPENSSYGLFK